MGTNPSPPIMNTPFPTPRPLFSVLLLVALFALLRGFGGDVFAQFPAGDLTVTVEELDGGEVRFSLAGSTPLREEGGFSNTGFNVATSSPPHALLGNASYSLPAGLKLSANGNDFALDYIYFNNGPVWHLGSFSSSTFPQSTNVIGSGTGVSSTIPFSNFIPGTYEVAGQSFDITYRVIARPETLPRLALAGPGRFPATLVGRGSRPRTLSITNTGNAAASGLRIALSGKGARDFKSTPAPTSLAAGGTAIVKITFKPRAKGGRKAEAVVTAANAAPGRVALIGKGR